MDYEAVDREGLKFLRWSMFDDPTLPKGSGYRYMDRKLVAILDQICAEKRIRYGGRDYPIILGYAGERTAREKGLTANSPHRAGLAARIRIKGKPRERFLLIQGLIQYGVRRIAVKDKWKETYVYFDVDNTLPDYFCVW